jgi:hypothetical protein
LLVARQRLKRRFEPERPYILHPFFTAKRDFILFEIKQLMVFMSCKISEYLLPTINPRDYQWAA